MFEPVDYDEYNKPPFLPGWMRKSETLDVAKTLDEQLVELGEYIKTISNQYDEQILENNNELLEKRGRLLGISRNGESNSEYLKSQQLRKKLNLNFSTIPDLIDILKTYYNNEIIRIEAEYPAGIVIYHYGDSPEKIDFNSFINECIGAGIDYTTKQYFIHKDLLNIKDKNKNIKKYILDNIHYNNEFIYDGFVQYGAMNENRGEENNLGISETMEYTVINV